jgi:DNA-binding beta-propeller fold protein YncE
MKAAAAALATALAAAAPALAASGSLHVPQRPSALALSADGAVLFVGVDRGYGTAGVLAFRRDAAGGFVQLGRADVADGVRAIAIAPGGTTIVVATRVGIATLRANAAEGAGSAAVRALRDGAAPGTSQVAVSRDGTVAFYTNTATATLGVARIDGDAPAVLAHVALDRAPQGLALSADGRTLYVASEVARDDGPPVAGADDARIARARCAADLGKSGVLTVIDTATLVADPAHAVVARIAAGCDPVRVAVTPSDGTVWVSDRGEDRVLAFSAARLRADPAHALLAAIAVGSKPVGLAPSADGTHVVTADSNRAIDPDAPGTRGAVSVIDVGAALRGAPGAVSSLPAGAEPREVAAAPDGTFFVTSAGERTVDIVTPPHDPGRNAST